MEEKMLKTSWKQRLLIAIIAAILLGSSIAIYVAVVLGNGGSSSSDSSDLDAIITEYSEKETEIGNLLSATYFETLNGYKSEVSAYNETSANANGVQYRDLKLGDGAEITAENTDYYAYYIGWCADETVFDSSFDDFENSTSLRAPLEVGNLSLIEGWTTGMVGAKVGGVRELTIPGELAYGETTEMCGGYNKPLKFIVMTIDISDEAKAGYAELDEIYNRYVEAYYAQYMSSIDLTESEE